MLGGFVKRQMKGIKMGITKTQVTVCTCDKCQKRCGESDMHIAIQLNSGHRDVGPTMLYADFELSMPYHPGKPILCRDCLMDALRGFVG